MQRVNVLGTEYEIMFMDPKVDPLLDDVDGYVDRSIKRIIISNRPDNCKVVDWEAQQKKVIRHEIIHAYFEESGLSVNVENPPVGVPETYVDWFALQSPKIYQTFKELEVL